MKSDTPILSFKKLLIQFKKTDEDGQNKIIANLINNLEYEKAMLLMGDHGIFSTHKKLSPNLIKRYAYLAIIKNMLMSHQSFIIISDQVIDDIFELKIPQENIASFLSAILSNYRTVEIFPKNKEILQLSNNSGSSTINYMFYLFEKKVLHFREFSEETDNRSYLKIFEYFNGLNNQQLNHLFYSAILFEYSESALKGNINIQHFEDLWKNFDNSDYKVLYGCNYHSTLGFFEYLKGNNQKALECFEMSLTLNPTATEKSYIIFWKDLIATDSSAIEDLIYLRCSPLASTSNLVSFNLFSHNTERRYHVDYYYKPFYKKLCEDNLSKNCWFFNVQNKEINREEYIEINPQASCLDFYSGIMKSSRGFKIISNHQLRALRIIFGCSNFGAHEILLIDLVYEQPSFKYESGRLRVKNLINQISKMGIYIIRKKNRYYYDFTKNNFDIIFPIDHKTRGLLAYISKSSSQLSLKTLTQDFKIKKSTASLNIKNWKNSGLIVNGQDLSRGEYDICKEKLHQVDRFFDALR